MATTVQFDKPVPRRGVRLKELTGQIFIRLGGPRAIVSSRAASVYRVETTGAIKATLSSCKKWTPGAIRIEYV